MIHDVALLLLFGLEALGLLLYGYIALTGRWITWPIKSGNIPSTDRGRRLAGLGGILLFLALALLSLNLLTRDAFAIGLFLAFPLLLASGALSLIGYRGRFLG